MRAAYLGGRELGLQRLDLPSELLGLRGVLGLELADAHVQALCGCEGASLGARC